MSNNSPNQSDSPDIKVFPPLASLIALAAQLGLWWFIFTGYTPSPAAFWTGVATLVVSAILPIAGVIAFKRAGTNVNPHKTTLTIVTNGPYRFTRNPMYLGMVLFQIGLGLALGNPWAAPAAILLWLSLHFGVVLKEEAYLTAKFGDDYTSLLARTRRWV
ncbi:MAG: methyltransferase family protein [Pikeienuella sp.]